MNNRLTIVLPLRGREEFTARFLEYGRDFKIIVADGSEWPDATASDFSGIDYFYAGYDANLTRYWHKMVLAFDRVETPYAMVADNDDMVCPSGLHRCCDWLDSSGDYIASSGRIQGFWYWPDQVHGPRRAFTKQYALYDVPADYAATDVNHRVLSGFQNSWSYYAVYRTEALRLIWQGVSDLNLTDLQVHEKYCAMRALTLGKIKCDGSFTSYLRQYDTSATAKHNSFTRNLMFCNDRNRVLNEMSRYGVDTAALSELWAQWYDAFLRRNYGPWPTLRHGLKQRFPRLAWLAQNRHRYLPMKWSYR